MLFPVYMDFSKENILVAGAGKIAARRVRSLCGFAGSIEVVAPEICDEIRNLSQEYPILLKEKGFSIEDLDGKKIVLAATDQKELNETIYHLCKERNIMVNVCSDQSLCDFQFPSLVVKDDIVIGINASGKDHSLVKQTRIALEESLGISGKESRYK